MTGRTDVFAVHRIDEQLAKAMDRKVWLPSGGTLVIDRTEAMTVVDVNTGKFTGSGGNLEQTVTRNNLEAAEEIVRQLRLRDIGGIVVIDFIDMVLESNRDLVLRRLTECAGPRPHPPPGVRGDVAGPGAADPQAVGHRADRGVLDVVPALRRPRDPAARRPGRLRAGDRPQVASPAAAAASASQEGPAERRGAAVAKVPVARRPASIRCSRRWPRPSASAETMTRTSPTRPSVEELAAEVGELDPDTDSRRLVEAADEDTRRRRLRRRRRGRSTTTSSTRTSRRGRSRRRRRGRRRSTTTIEVIDGDDDDLDDEEDPTTPTTTSMTDDELSKPSSRAAAPPAVRRRRRAAARPRRARRSTKD